MILHLRVLTMVLLSFSGYRPDSRRYAPPVAVPGGSRTEPLSTPWEPGLGTRTQAGPGCEYLLMRLVLLPRYPSLLNPSHVRHAERVRLPRCILRHFTRLVFTGSCPYSIYLHLYFSFTFSQLQFLISRERVARELICVKGVH